MIELQKQIDADCVAAGLQPLDWTRFRVYPVGENVYLAVGHRSVKWIGRDARHLIRSLEVRP